MLTMGAIAFASLLLVFTLSFQFGSYDTMINSSVKIHTGHVQIQAQGFQEEQNIRQVVDAPSEIAAILDRIPQVDAYTFRGEAFCLVSSRNRTHGSLVIGIDPEKEARVSRIKQLIRAGHYLAGQDDYPALVGEILATNLDVDLEDELTLLGQGRDGSIAAAVVRIKGIFRSGIDTFDRASLYIPLETFKEVYAMGDSVHKAVVIGKSLREVGKIKKSISQALSALHPKQELVVLNWEELMPGLRQGIELDLISGIIFYLFLILVVAFSILNTFLMAIFERTREFGVLMAIGVSPRRLTKLLLIESLSLTVLGISTGIVLGIVVTMFFQSYGIDLGGSSELLSQYGISGRMYPKLSTLSIFSGPAAVFVITFLAALYPALKIRRLKPVEAMVYV